MKKRISLSAAIICFSFLASAEFQVTLKGLYDFQLGKRVQSSAYDFSSPYSASIFSGYGYANGGRNVSIKNPSKSNQNNFAFNTFAKTGFLIEERESSTKAYGVNVMVNTRTGENTSFKSNFDRSYLFADSNYGRLELGSNFAASTMMSYGAHSVAVATGGASNGDWSYYAFDPYVLDNINDNYNGYYKQYINLLYQFRQNNENALKVSYFSPEYYNMQFGVSYTPDGSNAPGKSFVGYTPDYYLKDILSLGLTYGRKFGDIALGFSVVYDRGVNSSPDRTKNNLADLSSFVYGANFSIANVSFAGSYSKNKKDFAQPFYQGGNNTAKVSQSSSRFYTLGAAYSFKDLALSVTYANQEWSMLFPTGSSAYNTSILNKALTLGAEHIIMAGLKAYAEFTFFSLHNSLMETQTNPPAVLPLNKGKVFISGIKIQF